LHGPPLDFMTAANLWGIDLYKKWITSFDILFHSCRIRSHNLSLFVGLPLLTFFFKMDHRFPTGFKSGDCEDQSESKHIFVRSKYPEVFFDWWHEAPSCMKMESPLHVLGSPSFSILIYIWIYLSWASDQGYWSISKNSTPAHYLTVLQMYLLLNLLPIGLLTFLRYMLYIWIWNSSEKITFDHMSSVKLEYTLHHKSLLYMCCLVNIGFFYPTQ